MSENRPLRVSCWRYSCRPHRPCERCRQFIHEATVDDQRAWFERTGHCGACGQPGDYCLCTTPCGCADLHEVGCGRDFDAMQRFADQAMGDDGQEELFG